MKASVVVPVYNGADYLRECAPSLWGQSLDPSEFEIIYVDDGSTDDSLDVVRELAAAHDHVRYATIPNSGWPGRPRNVGIEMARGQYVQFVDQDDMLGPRALERMHATAAAEGTDIVLGKIVGTMANPIPVFRRAVPRARPSELDVFESMTGHKMFRRQFLIDHDIRFPEGPWRMEDLLFVARAYVKATAVSVVADYPCYIWNKRENASNLSLAGGYDLEENFRRLEVIIATIRDGLDPGEFRDRALRRFYRVETMQRASEKYLLSHEDPLRIPGFRYSAAVARSSFPPSVVAGLPAVQKLRARLLELDALDGAETLAERVLEIRPSLSFPEITLTDEGAVDVRLNFGLHWQGGPLRVVQRGSEAEIEHRFVGDLPQVADTRFDPLAYAHADLQLHDVRRATWWYCAAGPSATVEGAPDGSAEVVIRGRVRIQPGEDGGGAPLPYGSYVVWFTGQVLGVGRRRRLIVRPDLRGLDGTAVVADPRRATVLELGTDANLVLRVRRARTVIAERVRPVVGSVRRRALAVNLDGARTRVEVPGVTMTLARRGRTIPLTARYVPDGDSSTSGLLRLPRRSAGSATGVWSLHVGSSRTVVGSAAVVRGAVVLVWGPGSTLPRAALRVIGRGWAARRPVRPPKRRVTTGDVAS